LTIKINLITSTILGLRFIVPIYPISTTQPPTNEISIASYASKSDSEYRPSPLEIKINNTVEWTNKDFGTHTVTESHGLFVSEYLRPDQTFEYTFNSPGTFVS
jgi:plastocyanin